MGRKKGGGGKLNRSEIIQARLDPKLHMAAEIMARSERRTLSSFIEKTIEQSARDTNVKRNLKFLWWLENHEQYYVGKKTFDEVTVEEAVQDIADEHEAVRFVRFGMYFPELMNIDEKKMYHDIVYTCYFWAHYPYRVEDNNGKFIKTEWSQADALEGLDKDNLLEYWDRIKHKQIDFSELCILPPGKKIDHPLKEDARAIHKKIWLNKSGSSFNVIYANQHEQLEISPEDKSWKKIHRNKTARKIELKKTDDGAHVVATFCLESESELSWFEALINNREK